MTSVGYFVVQTFVTLAAVVALAVLILLGARRLGVGRPTGPLTLLGRLPLEGRRVVYLVQVKDRAFLIAAGESGIACVGELDAAGFAQGSEPLAKASFPELFRRVRSQQPSEQSHGDQ
jgi:flagellar biogenesis protein FliO